jgi:hypothetical protein
MKTAFIVLALALLMVAIAAFIWFHKEKFSDYNAPNDFMKIYYSNVAENPALVAKYPYWGTGSKVGLRCRKPNNGDCNTIWLSGTLVEITPTVVKNLECKYGLPFDQIITNIV